MKIKNNKAGKVHPSPSSSSFDLSSSKNNNRDALSVLNLLPAAILALASILSLQDREVLAYMITRSMKLPDSKKKCNKNPITHHHHHVIMNPPLFDCHCFDCYTCYWFRWDSSPNRELIHQAIEAFEEHGDQFNKISDGKSNRKEKQSRRLAGKYAAGKSDNSPVKFEREISPEIDGALVVISPEKVTEFEVVTEVGDVAVAEVMVKAAMVNGQHKAMARKVLPDVLSLFNSRLWSLWSPNL